MFVSAGDSTSSCSEDDVLVPDTRELSCASYPEPHLTIQDQGSLSKQSPKIEPLHPTSGRENALQQLQDNANNNETDTTTAAVGGPSAASTFAPSHVTLEALENTKVAVAQFAATALANGADEASLKELAMLQSTLYTLQHQQVFQIQLIHQLQSQVTESRSVDRAQENKPVNCSSESASVARSLECMRENTKVQLLKQEVKEIEAKKPRLECAEDEEVKLNHVKGSGSVANDCRIEESSISPIAVENCVPHSPNRVPSPMRSPMCHISTSFANSIITNHEHPPSANAPNSLEMLQKRAQEVLDSASQGLLSGNLVDELAFRKEKLAALDVNAVRGESLFKHRCRYCGKVFGSDSALQIHIRSHTGERPFQCHVCGSRFTTKGNLKVHYQRHTQTYSYMQMNSAIAMQEQDHYQNSPIHMKQTGRESPLYRSALDQISSLAPEQSLSIFSSVLNHQEQDEPADFSLPAPQISPITSLNEFRSSPSPNITTEMDNERFPRKTVVTRSQQNNHRIQRYIDASSDEEEVQSANRCTSRISVPNNDCPVPERKRLKQSPVRRQSLTLPTETSKLQTLVDNIEHTLTEANQCPVCNRIFSCKQTLDMHMQSHAEDGLFKCSICGRTFGTAENLKIHLNAHKIQSEMRSLYQCPICRKHFTNSTYLEQHVKGHATEFKDSQERRQCNVESESNIHRIMEMSSIDTHYKDEDMSEDEEPIERKQDNRSYTNADQKYRELAAVRRKQSPIIDVLNKSGERPNSISDNKLPQKSPISNDGALDLTPSSIPQLSPSNGSPVIERQPLPLPPIGMFPNFPFLPQSSITTSSPLNSLAQSVMPTGPFNPLGLAGMSPNAHNNSLMDAMQHGYHFLNDLVPGIRGNTTCNICFKTFACHSALEIHYRSHTKERPFKCGVCERGFSTKVSTYNLFFS